MSDNFLPIRVHVREQADDFKRLGQKFQAQWTPTILELDPDGTERHRVEGFLPADDFLAQLMLGRGHAAFKHEKWDEARKWFERVASELPGTEAAPEAQYWAGVSRYKGGDQGALGETAAAFSKRFKDTSWAKKASVWAPKPA